MVYKLEISKYCSRNERVRIKKSIKKTEKPGRNQQVGRKLNREQRYSLHSMVFHMLNSFIIAHCIPFNYRTVVLLTLT